MGDPVADTGSTFTCLNPKILGGDSIAVAPMCDWRVSTRQSCQGITAVARTKPHQDARLDLETKAKRLLDKAA